MRRGKENMKKFGAVILGLCMVVSLSGCGKSDIAEGSWALTKGYVGDMEVTQEQLEAAGAGGTTFTFKDGKVQITSTATEEVSEGTYTVEEDKITIEADETEVSYIGTITENELTLEETENDLDLKLVFEKE